MTDNGRNLMSDTDDAYQADKARAAAEAEARYRATHSREGYGLGGPEYPDNRVGRRAMARTWKRANR